MGWKSSVTTIAYEGSILRQERSRRIFQPDVGLAAGDPRALSLMQPSSIGGCIVTARDLPKEKIHPSSLLGQSGKLLKSVYEARLCGFETEIFFLTVSSRHLE